MRSRTGPAGRFVSAGVLVGVAAHHLWLLWTRLATGQLLDPNIILRWGIGLLLVLGLVSLRRSGASIVWGKRACVYWLLVLVFHGAVTGPLAEPGLDLTRASAPAQVALLVWPVSVAPLVLAVAALSGRGRSRRPMVSLARDPRALTRPARRLLPGSLLQTSPRPPPA